MNRIQLTEEFLKEKFNTSEYFAEHESERAYRLEHSYRVANIGKQIAEAEGFDVECMVIGCLLHDVSYCQVFEDGQYVNHGRVSAKIARPFLETLNLSKEQIEDICYGIAIHVDDQADFEGERTTFALTIGDADNIDRFDAYRIYENLQYRKYSDMTLEQKVEYVNTTLEKLPKFKDLEFATTTSKQMWVDKLDFQIEYYNKLKNQNECSKQIK